MKKIIAMDTSELEEEVGEEIVNTIRKKVAEEKLHKNYTYGY